MKVKDLISMLSELNPEAPIILKQDANITLLSNISHECVCRISYISHECVCINEYNIDLYDKEFLCEEDWKKVINSNTIECVVLEGV